MKKTNILAAALGLILAGTAAGCSVGGSAASVPADKTADKKLKIVTTIYPEYDWVKQIMGEKASDADIVYLLKNGTDLHSYQPSVEDIAAISDCDLFVYVGGESDKWAEAALKNSTNPGRKTIELMEIAGDSAKEEEVKEGMEAEDEHDHDHGDEDHDHDEDEHHHGEAEYDEHVWLSVKLAKKFCSEIAEKLCELDPDGALSYKSNLDGYTAKLGELDAKFEEAVAALPEKTLIFGDRFPFRYFVEDYGLNYYAAFLGCSAETEASFETVVFLADKIDELGVKAVFRIETSDGRLAQTITSNAKAKDVKLLTLNSLQSAKPDAPSYIEQMSENLEVIKEYSTLMGR